jgi:microcystin-dependent protein
MEKKTLQKLAYVFVIVASIVVIFTVLTWSRCKKRYEDYTNTTGPLSGPNNMVLTDEQGNLSSIQFPPGMIIAWKPGKDADKTHAPAGWAICDGQNDTPDLRGRFILGSNPYNSKNENFTARETDEKDGKETTTFTLTVANIPAHKHKLSPIEANGVQTFPTQWGSGSGGAMAAGNWGVNKYNGDYNTDSTGSGTAVTGVPIMPPFYTLIYIMKL